MTKKMSARVVTAIENSRRAKKPVAIANVVEAAIAELDALESWLRNMDEKPWLKIETLHTRMLLAKVEEMLARARQDVAIAEWDAKDGPEVTKWTLTVKIGPGGRQSFESAIEERLVEDAIRAYAFPESWGYVEKPEEMFRCDFTIEANERDTWEYVEEIRDVAKSWLGFGDWKIEEVTK
jgi:hypothetical protein